MAKEGEETGNPYLERFMKVYSNLPFEERGLTVLVIEEKPIDWNMAYRELEHNTELGKKIGIKLVELQII